MNFTISLSQATDHDVTVTYSTQQGSATGMGVDYFGTTGITVTIPAGQTSIQISVATREDTAVEPNEQFFVNLSNPVGATIADGQGTGTILNDDVAVAPPVISLAPAVVAGEEGTGLTFTFTRTGGDLTQPLTINYVVNDALLINPATRADGDFNYPSGIQQITFAGGQTVATITVQTNEDTKVEADESFTVVLAGGLDYTVDPVSNSSTGTIINDDIAPLPIVSVVATDGVGTEAPGDEPDFIFTFTRTGDVSQPLAVNYGIIPAPVGGATPGVDFLNIQTSPIIFAPGQATVVLAFNAIDDTQVENPESFAVVLQPGSGYTFSTTDGSATANAIIVDNDVAPPPAVVSLAPAVVAGEEGTGLTFTFTRTGGDLTQPLTINYVVNDMLMIDPATRADGDFDYPEGMQQITFAAGQTVATITVQTNEDSKVEANESFTVVLAGGLDYTVDPVSNSSTGTIINDDVAPLLPTLSIVDASANEEAGTMTFTVTLSTAAAGPVTFTYSTADGSAGSSDYVGVTNQIGTIPAGQTSTTITIALTNDKIVEPSGETFFLNLSNPVGATIADGQATGTILEQDQLIVGTPNPDTLAGAAGDDTIQGLDSNDRLTGGGGDDTIDGGDNLDIATFSGLRSQYTITPGGVPGSSTVADNVPGRDGTDALTNIELTEFSNTYVLNQRILNLSSFGGLAAGKQIVGTNLNVFGDGDSLTVGNNANGRLIDLAGGGTDTLLIALGGGTPLTVGLNVAGVENIGMAAGVTGSLTVQMQSTLNGTNVDLGNLNDTLNLFGGNNVVTATNIENVNAFSTAGNNTVDLFADLSQNLNINFAAGPGVTGNVLNLGTSGNYNMSVSGGTGLTVKGTAGNEHLILFNQQNGTTYDLGGGSDDSVQLASMGPTNSITVKNVETVIGSSFNDAIVVANTSGTTTITGGFEADFMTASGGIDDFRFTSVADSPSGGGRDQVTSVDAGQDHFVFDGMLQSPSNITGFRGGSIDFIGAGNGPIPMGTEAAFTGGGDQSEARLVDAGGLLVLQIDVDADGAMTVNDMEIQLVGLTGILNDSNFLLV